MANWKELSHAYGSAEDIPDLLALLDPDPEDEVWVDLWSRVCHQGTVYDGSYPVLPYLAKLASDWPPAQQVMPLVLACSIITSIDAPDNREELLKPYTGDVDKIKRILDESLDFERHTQEDYVHLLKSSLGLSGHHVFGEYLDGLNDGELEGRCSNCDVYLYLVIGSYGFFSTSEDWVSGGNYKREMISPCKPESLPPIGKWIRDKALLAQQITLSDLVLYIFGDTTCSACKTSIKVNDAIENMA